MVWSWNGNTSGSATSAEQGLPNQIEYFTIVPKMTSVVNVYKITNGGDICIMSLNKSISTGDMWEGTGGSVILATEQIKVQVSGNVDYDFTLKTLEP
jgi:hypothetical protein